MNEARLAALVGMDATPAAVNTAMHKVYGRMEKRDPRVRAEFRAELRKQVETGRLFYENAGTLYSTVGFPFDGAGALAATTRTLFAASQNQVDADLGVLGAQFTNLKVPGALESTRQFIVEHMYAQLFIVNPGAGDSLALAEAAGALSVLLGLTMRWGGRSELGLGTPSNYPGPMVRASGGTGDLAAGASTGLISVDVPFDMRGAFKNKPEWILKPQSPFEIAAVSPALAGDAGRANAVLGLRWAFIGRDQYAAGGQA